MVIKASYGNGLVLLHDVLILPLKVPVQQLFDSPKWQLSCFVISLIHLAASYSIIQLKIHISIMNVKFCHIFVMTKHYVVYISDIFLNNKTAVNQENFSMKL